MDPSSAFEEFEEMAMAQCPLEDILFFLKVTQHELDTVFKAEFNSSVNEMYQAGLKRGLIKLRVSQFNQAIDGDKTMLTLLGKEYLDQGKDDSDDGDDTTGGVIILPPHKPIGAPPGTGDEGEKSKGEKA